MKFTIRTTWLLLMLAATVCRADESPVILSAPNDPELDANLKTAQAFLEPFCGLRFKQQVTIVRRPRAIFRQQQADAFKLGKAQREKQWALLETLGLITNARSAEIDMQSYWTNALAGYYSYEEKQIVLPEGQTCQLLTLVHELQHALLDQSQGEGIQALIDAAKDDEEQLAIRAAIEGVAMFSEEQFDIWRERRGSVIPTNADFSSLEAKVNATFKEVYGAPKSTNLRTIESELQFPYVLGLRWAIQSARESPSFESWVRTQFVAERLPHSTREMIDMRGFAPFPTGTPYNAVLKSWMQSHHATWKVVDSGRLGELYLRMWWRRSLLEILNDDTIPLGVADDWFCLLQDKDGFKSLLEIVGFDSNAQAKRVADLLRADGGIRALNSRKLSVIDRHLIVEIGVPPQDLRVLLETTIAQRPVHAASTPFAPLASFDSFLISRDQASWDHLLEQLKETEHRSLLVDRWAAELFSSPASDPQSDDRFQHETKRSSEFGKNSVRELPKYLTVDENRALTAGAVSALKDADSLPIHRLNALRWLTKTPVDLTSEQRDSVLTSTQTYFGHRPELVNLIGTRFSKGN